MTVHPHVCGEHTRSACHSPLYIGSSPRVWGTFHRSIVRPILVRFIPTCVGNILPLRFTTMPSSVHPHVCGEHSNSRLICRKNPGSSPRVWGTFADCPKGYPGKRFIPTCVGNIAHRSIMPFGWAVHPHVCGEHSKIARAGFIPAGSSPRVWGT